LIADEKRTKLSSMATTNPSLDDLYVVLRAWAVARPGQIHTYTELSKQYQARTGDWFDPHGSWDEPLGALNQRLHGFGAPALSALVVLNKDPPEPGGGFWGCAPSVPPRPRTEMQRLLTWQAIVKAVHTFRWPSSLP
jgi:hypothetical protein